jgi:MFS family permease
MTAPLKEERVPFRNHAFNFLLVLVMKVSFLTYFVLAPWLKNISVNLSVSLTVATLIAPVYEFGKFIGCILYGRLGDTKNTLTCTLASMGMFVILACLLTAYLAYGWRTHTPLDFVTFAVLYLPLSVLCIAPQFGLAILKKTN